MAAPRLQLNITGKFMAYLVLISILPLLVLGIASHHVARDILQRQASDYLVVLLRDQRDQLLLQLHQVENLMANLSGVEEILKVLGTVTETPDTYTSLATQAQVGYILNNYTNLQGLVSIDIFTVTGQHYHVGDTLDAASIHAATRDELFRTALNSDRLVLWSGVGPNVNANSSYKQVLTASKILRRVDRETLQSRPIAMLLVNISVASLYDHFRSIDVGRGGYLLLVDQGGRLIYHPNRALTGSHLDPALTPALRDGPEARTTLTLAGTAMAVSQVELPDQGWHLVSVVPTRALTAGSRAITQATIITLAVCFAVVIALALRLAAQVVRPIRTVTQSLQQFRSDTLDLTTRLPVNRRDELGALAQWFNVFMETLAAQRNADAALRESEERYSLAVRGANDGLWDWDLRSDRLYLSPRFKAMLGFTYDELDNTPATWFARIHPDDVDAVEEALRAHRAGETSHFECEYRMRHRDGSYRWVLGRGLAVRDTIGRATRMAGSQTDITSRKHSEEQLRREAWQDSVTGLYNRGWFLNRLGTAVERLKRRDDYRFAVLFLDLDGFKGINDRLGHAAGDQLLEEVGRRLQQSLRSVDAIARLGGDEFVMLLEDVEDGHSVTIAAERILTLLGEPYAIAGEEVRTAASIGVALSAPEYDRGEQILRDADVAMYRAKQLGKARFEFFDASLRQQIISRKSLETQLRKALEENELRLHYLPIVRLVDGQVSGFELLLRWQHPERGLLLPEEFLAAAERRDLSLALLQWEVQRACARLRRWRTDTAPAAPITLSINLSARQLLAPETATLLKDFVGHPSPAVGQLAVEVSEQVIMEEPEAAGEALKRLHALGVRIHLDHFGAGLASLRHLTRDEVDAIKLDHTIVAQLGRDSGAVELTRTVLLVVRELGLDLIADGVERADQAALLAALGCTHGQGLLFSPPLDEQEADALVAHQEPLRGSRARLS